MLGCHLVATDDAEWSDELWEMDLWRQMEDRDNGHRLAVPSTDTTKSLQLAD